MASTVFVSIMTLGVPFAALLYAYSTRRLLPFLLGVSAFVVSQIIIRLPLLELLAAKSSSYLLWSVKYPIAFVLFLSFTAGIFEELARWIAMTYWMKQRDGLSGVVFGLGHGGIEAFLLVGLPVMTTLANIHWLSGAERLIAIVIHIGLSLIVLDSVKRQRFAYCVLAICLHGMINAFAGLLPFFLPAPAALIVIETVLFLLAILTLSIAIVLRRKGDGK